MLIQGMEVEVAGQGPGLVLVHGLGGTGNVWQPQLALLAQHFTVVRPDLAGAGRSPLSGELSVTHFVSDLLAVLDHLGWQDAAFAGHSFGSLILQHLAAAAPRRVRRLALVGPIKALAEAGQKGTRERAAKVRAEGMIAVADAIVAAATAPATKTKPVACALIREFLMRQNPEGYASTCEALAAAVDPALSRIQCPTLLLTGTDDVIGSPATAARLHGEIANSSVSLIADCGHWATIEQPEMVGAALAGFFSG